jgi:hypothetical protein
LWRSTLLCLEEDISQAEFPMGDKDKVVLIIVSLLPDWFCLLWSGLYFVRNLRTKVGSDNAC